MGPNSTSQPPEVTLRVSAPGKVILHGEHSVVYDKLAFAASLGLRTRLQFSEVEAEAAVVSLDFSVLSLLHFYSLQDIQDFVEKPLPLTKAPSHYNFTHPELVDHDRVLKSVHAFMQAKTGSHPLDANQQRALTSFLYLFWCFLAPVEAELRPFKLELRSELTLGSGTGSSASFAVAVAAFLVQLVRVKRFKSKKAYKGFKISNANLGVFDKNELELISRWAFQSERIIHGTPSGVDNTVCTYGGLVEFRKGTTPRIVELSLKFNLIMIDTKVARDTKRLVEIVATRREKHKLIIDSVLETIDQVTVRALDLMKRINRRVGDEFDVLKHYEALGELTDINQDLLHCLGVSHPKLDEVCLFLAEKGLHGKLTGAGGGGFAICLVPPYFDREVVAEVIDELNRRDFRAVLTELGGCGVSIDSF